MSFARKQKFYKYQSCNSKYFEENLKNLFSQKIYLASKSNLNDPFEGSFRFRNSVAPRELAQAQGVAFDNFLKQCQKNEPNLTAEELRKNLNSEEWNQCCEKLMVKEFFKNHGILCLTSDSSNIPMWAHYGDNYKGYCVAFELDFDWLINHIIKDNNLIIPIPEDMRNKYIYQILVGEEIISFILAKNPEILGVFAKIDYRDEPPTLHMSEFNKINNQNEHEGVKYIVKNSIGVKFKQWWYEEEYRLILNLNSKIGGYMSLPHHAPFLKVTGIILGDKMEPTHKKYIQDLWEVSGKTIELFQAKCSDEEYKITHEPYLPILREIKNI